MVNEYDLIKLEAISSNLIDLMILIDLRISNRKPNDRFSARAKSSFYNTLATLLHESVQLKMCTTIIPSQLIEFKRKINNLLRLADETGIKSEKEESILTELQQNVQFSN